ncbi:MAG: CvpA family protein [Helicobacteraceae bacterium]|nr:CvpA family protein [Helicobacteraceae bacterium]
MSALDIIVLILIAVLGVRGFLRGAIREAFSLVGVVLGIVLGSRLGMSVGRWAVEYFNLSFSAGVMQLTGFVLLFAVCWGVCFLLGYLIAHFIRARQSGEIRKKALIIDRLCGFFIGTFKVFFIFSVIFYAFSLNNSVGGWMDRKFDSSFMYPALKKVGSLLFKYDAQKTLQKLEQKVEEGTVRVIEKTQEIKEKVEESAAKVQEILEELEENTSEESSG